jgi:hypothetical protein
MPRSITIHNVDDATDKWLAEETARRGMSAALRYAVTMHISTKFAVCVLVLGWTIFCFERYLRSRAPMRTNIHG